MSVDLYSLPKPRFRGRLHQFAFFASIPQGIALVVAAGADSVARLAGGIFAFSLAALYATSSLYHRIHWSPRGFARMRRLDHSVIFVLIAGTFTAVKLLALHGWWSNAAVVAIWVGAGAGIVMKLVAQDKTRKITGGMYIGLGWIGALVAPQFVSQLTPLEVGLIIAGGILYTGGAIILALRRPDPSPLVFGYHEIWHVCVVAASLCHYAAIMLLVLGR